MKSVTRKKFLAVFSATFLGMFLAGCFNRKSIISTGASFSGDDISAPEQAQPVDASNEYSKPSGTPEKNTGTTEKIIRKKAVAGIAGNSESVEFLVNKAVGLAGGLGFIRSGSTVLLKPNFNTGDKYPASTNPEVIRQVIRLVKKQNPLQIIIADRSGFWLDTEKCMKQNGASNVAVEEGAETEALEYLEWKKIIPRLALNWPNGFRVPEILTEVDYVISIPVLKTHSIADFSMSIKNWVGILYAKDRVSDLHLFNSNKNTFGSKLAELLLARVPDFIVMDGTRAFVEGGPTEGKIFDSNLIVASNDIIANDITGLAVLKNIGTIREIQDRSVWEHPQISRAVQLGLGARSASGIEINHSGIDYINNIIDELKI